MKLIATCNELTLKCYVYSREILPLVILSLLVCCLLPAIGFAEGGTNYLSGLKADVGKTFGAGSDIEYYLYLGEGILTGIGYIKTKNIMLLGGLPVLMLFTHWALK